MKQTIQRMCKKILTFLLIVYFYVVYWTRGIQEVQNKLRFLTNPAPILKTFGAGIGEGTIIYPGIVIHAAQKDFSNLQIGSQCRIMTDAFLDLTDKIILNDNCCVGIRSVLLTHTNGAKSPVSDVVIEAQQSPIVFECGAICYTNATILLGVTLGECCVVGAGSVIRKSVPAYTVVSGNPARIVKCLDPYPPTHLQADTAGS